MIDQQSVNDTMRKCLELFLDDMASVLENLYYRGLLTSPGYRILITHLGILPQSAFIKTFFNMDSYKLPQIDVSYSALMKRRDPL